VPQTIGYLLRHFLFLAALLVFPQMASAQPPANAKPLPPLPQGMLRQHLTGVENFIRVSDRLYSGGEPTAEGLQQLKTLGIETILSVDGLAPDVATAQQLGIQYVHIPLGYNGIEPEQIQAFVTFMSHTKGKIFVHCHHGKHRGPAAVAACLILSQEIDRAQALKFMQGAGTSKDYRGLWKSIEQLDPAQFKPQAATTLKQQPKDKSAAQWMAELDRAWEIIQEQQTAGIELDSSQLLIVAEALRETSRVVSKSSSGTWGDAKATQQLIAELDHSRELTEQAMKLTEKSAHEKARVLIKTLAQKCADCHAQYRNGN
jgi:protein tyrosine phosphatase (PTP) superfamily phosphohydrolase (DUF442 family)